MLGTLGVFMDIERQAYGAKSITCEGDDEGYEYLWC